MQFTNLRINGPVEITPTVFSDDRGYFIETFNANALQSVGIGDSIWIQDNQSYSKFAYTLRGLHYQLAPFSQAKLVRVLRGSIFDVAVDLRPSSATFGKWDAVTLAAGRFNQLYIPPGFAHGFLTLEPDVEVAYKVTAFYSRDHDRSIRWSDERLAVDWPLPPGSLPVLSSKDATAPDFDTATLELKQLATR